LREKPPTGGVSVYRESVPLRPDVREHAERLLRHFGWTGAAMVEFKEDARTGIPYLMEVNGRFWGSLQLAIDAGVNFPVMLVRLALDEDVDPPSGYELGVRSRWLWGDFDHLLAVLRTPRWYRDAHPTFPSRGAALAKFLVPWRPGDRFEILRLTDLLPFFRESIQWIRSLRE
jgi:predicted ATP-grasp superfamily ATP-dependent carboligase